jgi:hypothetical protein
MQEPLPSYVILHHTGHGPEHWDLMLEVGESLATWQLLEDPHRIGGEALNACRIGDHRRAYLTLEGPVSGGRGRVKRIDRGTFEWVERTERSWIIRLQGDLLQGTFKLALEHRRAKRWSFQRLA